DVRRQLGFSTPSDPTTLELLIRVDKAADPQESYTLRARICSKTAGVPLKVKKPESRFVPPGFRSCLAQNSRPLIPDALPDPSAAALRLLRDSAITDLFSKIGLAAAVADLLRKFIPPPREQNRQIGVETGRGSSRNSVCLLDFGSRPFSPSRLGMDE